MFKISWKNYEPSQRYGPDKFSREEEERRNKINNDKNNSLPLWGRLIIDITPIVYLFKNLCGLMNRIILVAICASYPITKMHLNSRSTKQVNGCAN